jgi:hypothetical protein
MRTASVREEDERSLRIKRRKVCESFVGKGRGMGDTTGAITGLRRTGRRVASDCNR